MSNIVNLDLDTPAIQYLCQKDRHLAKVINTVGPIKYLPHSEDAYSFLIHEIIEQMLSIKSGQRIYNRLENLCKGNINPTTVYALTDEQIRSTGTSTAKVGYIRNTTSEIICGNLSFDCLEKLSDEEVINSLTKLRGIGKWTAKMYLIFVLDRPDVLPLEDGAFLQAYRWVYKTEDCSEKAVIQKCKKWKPYSSIASRYMYRALDMGLTKKEFHLHK